jgi:hypothetical protein
MIAISVMTVLKLDVPLMARTSRHATQQAQRT